MFERRPVAVAAGSRLDRAVVTQNAAPDIVQIVKLNVVNIVRPVEIDIRSENNLLRLTSLPHGICDPSIGPVILAVCDGIHMDSPIGGVGDLIVGQVDVELSMRPDAVGLPVARVPTTGEIVVRHCDILKTEY